MGGACSKYGQERCIQGFGGGNLREGGHLEDSSVDGIIILKWIFKKWDIVAWTGLIWLRTGIGCSLENAVRNLLVPYNAGSILSS
jgi:hypothetical protein